MLKDIDFKKVTDIAMVATPNTEEGSDDWKVYLINLRDEAITGVMVSSVGYGTVDGKEVKTSALRQLIDRIEPNGYFAIELITTELKGLSNQFWVSFWQNGELFDRKYVFVKESINEEFMTNIPVLNTRGVMIK